MYRMKVDPLLVWPTVLRSRGPSLLPLQAVDGSLVLEEDLSDSPMQAMTSRTPFAEEGALESRQDQQQQQQPADEGRHPGQLSSSPPKDRVGRKSLYNMLQTSLVSQQSVERFLFV